MAKNALQLLQQRSIHTELIKLRCTPDLKTQLIRKAIAKESDLSTVARDAFRFYLAHDEKRSLVAR
jgi:hypothetical protein